MELMVNQTSSIETRSDKKQYIKHLYITGNGFDIHHDMGCSYADYRVWLEENEPTIYDQLCQFYDIPIDRNDEKEWWKDFEKMLSEVNIHDYVNDIVPDNYPDFSSDEFRDRDYHAAEIAADNELSNLIYNIKNTFADWIANLDKPNPKKCIHLERKDSLFITFNYTHTLEELYRIPVNQVFHIHGEVGGADLILGHGKNYADLKNDIEANIPQPPIDLDENELAEWYENHSDFITDQTQEIAISHIASLQKDVEGIIADNNELWNSLADVEHIHVFGLSFSDIDIPYLNKIIKHINTDKVKWEISAFSDKDEENVEKFMETTLIKKHLWQPLIELKDVTKYKQGELF